MPDQYAGEVPILFVVPAPGQEIDLRGLEIHLERNIMEPPAKPKRVVVLEALPVTAVGKIFKPTLRDLAIEEKAKLEIERVFGAGSKRRDHCRQRRKAEYARSHRRRYERQYAATRTYGKPRIPAADLFG